MWTFLITEVLFFGGMFTAYAIYRGIYPAAFASTSEFMNVKIGATNTAVLIVQQLDHGDGCSFRADRRSASRWFIFLWSPSCWAGLSRASSTTNTPPNGITELVPGLWNSGPDEEFTGNALGFGGDVLLFYFFMTGLHALHMIVGVGIMAVLP